MTRLFCLVAACAVAVCAVAAPALAQMAPAPFALSGGDYRFTEWAETGGVGDLSQLPLEEQGAVLSKKNACQTCHSIDGAPGTGPTWKGLYGQTGHATSAGPVTVDENYLREAILNPGAKLAAGYANVMPANYSTLPGDQVDAMIAYIKTLK